MATKVPNIMHLDSIQRLPGLFRRAHELHLIPSEVLNCLPPLPSMSDLHKLKDDFKTSLPSLSGWNLAELLTNCLPEQFSLVNQTDHNVVLSHGLKDLANTVAPPNGLPNLKVAIVFSLLPFFQKPEFRKFRASLFFGMGVSGLAPIVHKLILYWDLKEALQTTCYEVLMGVFYGLGALVYAAIIPERWRPGKFDIAGHSHQLFHVLVVAGAYTHYHAGLVYLHWRDFQGCSDMRI